jgi:molybdenum cofactor synthesis domain-containing protein
MIPLPDARQVVLDRCQRLDPVEVARPQALGCVLAEPIGASEPVPPFDNTAMDGFAVRAADTVGAPRSLAVVGTLAAGSAPEVEVGPGQALRIMTGAPLPGGADAIVMVEQTRPGETEGTVVVEAEARPGDHVRRAGDDLRAGQVVFPAGTVLGPAHLGVLTSVSAETVVVVPRPRVGVITTGDELVEGAAPLRLGQIRDSNRPTLLAVLGQSGFVPVDFGVARDDPDILREVFARAVRSCDAVLTTGGVSVGDFDYSKVVLDELSGHTMAWMQVAIRPAQPFAFGRVEGTPVFGRPGNPVSSSVSFECFARPALRQMAGHGDLERPTVLAIADDGLARRSDGKLHLLRVVATFEPDGRVHVRSAGGQGSHQLSALAAAHALALVPDGGGVSPGGSVPTWLLWP